MDQLEVGRRRILAGAKHARENGKLSILDTDLRLGIGAQVLDPAGSVVFRDDVETSLPLGKPDFDLAWLTASASARGEIEILFLRDWPSL